jgi:hypothetical protein
MKIARLFLAFIVMELIVLALLSGIIIYGAGWGAVTNSEFAKEIVAIIVVQIAILIISLLYVIIRYIASRMGWKT